MLEHNMQNAQAKNRIEIEMSNISHEWLIFQSEKKQQNTCEIKT